MLERLKRAEWYYQLLVLLGVAALLYFMVYYFVTSETRAEIAALQTQIDQLQAKNKAAQLATERIGEFRAAYAAKQAEYDELKVLLPEDREITNVLQGLQDTARASRLIVSRFSPKDDKQEDYIMAKPVEIEVDSNFDNLREFFDKMAKLQRIVSITDFSLNQLENQMADRTLHAQFLLTAYYAAPEEMTPPPAEPGKPGAPGKNAKPGDPKTAKPGASPAASPAAK